MICNTYLTNMLPDVVVKANEYQIDSHVRDVSDHAQLIRNIFHDIIEAYNGKLDLDDLYEFVNQTLFTIYDMELISPDLVMRILRTEFLQKVN